MFFDYTASQKQAFIDRSADDINAILSWIDRLSEIASNSSSAEVLTAMEPSSIESDAMVHLSECLSPITVPIIELQKELAAELTSSSKGAGFGAGAIRGAASLERHLRVIPSMHHYLQFAIAYPEYSIDFDYVFDVSRADADLTYTAMQVLRSWALLEKASSERDWGYISNAITIWKQFPSRVATVTEQMATVACLEYCSNPDLYRKYSIHECARPRLKHLRNWRILGSAAARDTWPASGRSAVEAILGRWDAAYAFLKAGCDKFRIAPEQVLILDELQIQTEVLLFQDSVAMPASGSEWPYSIFPVLDRRSPEEREEYNALIKRGLKVLGLLEAAATNSSSLKPPKTSAGLEYSSTAPRTLIPADPTRFYHGEGFRSVTWDGVTYDEFTVNQAACMKVLWENWVAGNGGLSQISILDTAGTGGNRLDEVFKRKIKGTNRKELHPAWGKVIVRGASSDTFKLNAEKQNRRP